LPRVIWHLDDPIADPAAITSFLICQTARQQNTKVLLSGQGGDEVFCGYPWHLAVQISRYYDRLPRAARAMLEKVLGKLPAAKGGPLTATFRRLRKFNNSASLAFEERLIGFLSYAYTENLEGLLGERYPRQIHSGLAERAHVKLLKQSSRWHYIDRMLHLDMGTFLPSLNLAYTDKTSMAFGVEVRVPYIDNEVVDFLATVPPQLKMRGTVRKYLLKKALRGLVPDYILNRKKEKGGLRRAHSDLDCIRFEGDDRRPPLRSQPQAAWLFQSGLRSLADPGERIRPPRFQLPHLHPAEL